MSIDLEQSIFDIIRDKVSIPETQRVDRDTSIGELGVQSIDAVEIFFELEDRLGIDADPATFPIDGDTTVGDLIDFARSKQQSAS